MLILVVLYATWCPKCHMMLPIVDELEMEFSREWKIRRIDIEKQPDEAANYDIEIVPTFILQKDGKEIGRMIGKTENLQSGADGCLNIFTVGSGSMTAARCMGVIIDKHITVSYQDDISGLYARFSVSSSGSEG